MACKDLWLLPYELQVQHCPPCTYNTEQSYLCLSFRTLTELDIERFYTNFDLKTDTSQRMYVAELYRRETHSITNQAHYI